MSQSLPAEKAFKEFLRNLSVTIHASDPIVLVLRGSLLLRHWFGESARPPADIDLECFNKAGAAGRGGGRQRFTSVIDNARGLCCFAAEESLGRRENIEAAEFVEIDAPVDGQSLWSYGSPGERFYLGWVRHEPERQSGQIQVDIAESGSYNLNDIGIAEADFVSAANVPFRFPAYTPEAMLAAKLSWLMRSLNQLGNGNSVETPVWTGEPKDLFDIHLLLTRGHFDPDLFQKSLLAIGAADNLKWNSLEAIFDVRRANMCDADFANWEQFRERHASLITSGPVEMLQTVANRLEPLLGDFYRRKEFPFLLALNARPTDEFIYLVYADWLKENGDSRCDFLRLFSDFSFRKNDFPPQEFAQMRLALMNSFRESSVPWLQQLFGTSSRYREIRRLIEDEDL